MLRRATPLILAGCAGLLVGAAVLEPEKAESQRPAWMAMGKPNSNHARLASLAGDWDQTIHIYSHDGTPPMESKGTAKYRVILGGRFVTEEVKMILDDKTTFEWTGMYGFDNRKNKYIAFWADNLGTDFEQGEGENGLGGNDISFIGRQIEPSTGEETKFRWTMKLESQSEVSIVMNVFGADGKEVKMLEIEQKRR